MKMQKGKLYKSKKQEGLVVSCIEEDKIYFRGMIWEDNGVGIDSTDFFNVIDFEELKSNNEMIPSHYQASAIQPIDYILSNGLDFCEGNVIKYITRYKQKNGIEDLKKAKQYIDFIINNFNNK